MNNDQIIIDLQEKLTQRKNKIVDPGKTSPMINCQFPINGRGTINLHTIHNINDLLPLAAILIREKESFEKANEYCGTEEVYMYSTHTFEEWMHDIKMRINKLKFVEETKKLQQIQSKLLSLESDDLKKSRELEEIKKLLD